MPAYVDNEKCNGCGACADECPAECITMEDDLAVVDNSECTDCGTCEDECPEEAIRVEEE